MSSREMNNQQLEIERQKASLETDSWPLKDSKTPNVARLDYVKNELQQSPNKSMISLGSSVNQSSQNQYSRWENIQRQ